MRQVDARDRKMVYLIARGVRLGMAGNEDYTVGMRELEITASKEENTGGAWEALITQGKG